MVSSHDATSPCDLLQGLVAGTSPIVCADLYDSWVVLQRRLRAAREYFSNITRLGQYLVDSDLRLWLIEYL